MITGFTVVAITGGLMVHQALQGQKSVARSPIASKSLIPNYRIQKTKSASISALKAQPLRHDGNPAKAGKDFLALKNTYNLSLIPTYDGSNQSTHPKLLYFPNGWNGYKYWMSITPYQNTIDRYENPCIVTSNDLKTWVVPKGEKNPVSGIPVDVKYGGHYSDSQLLMVGNTMQLWYRYNKGDKKTKHVVYSPDYYYRITSTNGINWSKPQLMHSSKWSLMSLAIIYKNGQYQFWYTNCAKHLMYAVSKDGINWANTTQCDIKLPKGYTPWHQDIVFYNNRYYLLQTAKKLPQYSFSLYLSESSDGVHFTPGTAFYPSSNPTILHRTWLYRSTFVPVESGLFQMVISYRLPGNKWFMTQCSVSAKDWNNACFTNKELILKAPETNHPVKLARPAFNSGGQRQKTQKALPQKPAKSIVKKVASI